MGNVMNVSQLGKQGTPLLWLIPWNSILIWYYFIHWYELKRQRLASSVSGATRLPRSMRKCNTIPHHNSPIYDEY